MGCWGGEGAGPTPAVKSGIGPGESATFRSGYFLKWVQPMEPISPG